MKEEEETNDNEDENGDQDGETEPLRPHAAGFGCVINAMSQMMRMSFTIQIKLRLTLMVAIRKKTAITAIAKKTLVVLLRFRRPPKLGREMERTARFSQKRKARTTIVTKTNSMLTIRKMSMTRRKSSGRKKNNIKLRSIDNIAFGTTRCTTTPNTVKSVSAPANT